MGNGEMVLVRIDVPGAFAGRMVGSVNDPGRMLVVALDRMGKVTIPTEDSTFQEGDVAHIIVRREDLDDLRRRLAEEEHQ
jgi:Trk K+ transport system NAD-binding subunit